MIKITTEEIKGTDKFEYISEVNGSAKEIIRYFYSLHELIKKNSSIALLYGIAIKKWETKHEDN